MIKLKKKRPGRFCSQLIPALNLIFILTVILGCTTMFRFSCIPVLVAAIICTTHAWPWEQSRCSNQPHLICKFRPIQRSGVRGVAYLSPVWLKSCFFCRGRCATKIEAKVSGLTEAKQGWHIHEFGDITDPKGLATGPHYKNPFGKPTVQGLPGDRNRDWGDIGNLVNKGNGRARYSRVDDTILYTSAVAGRGMIIHAKEDFGGRPGKPGSGARLAQCVLGIDEK